MSRIDLDFSPLRPAAMAALAALTFGLAACVSNDTSYKAIDINIAHINDHHSQLDPIAAQTLKLDGIDTQVDLGGFARQTTVFKSLAGTPNLLKLHAGDAITGTLYYTFFKGEADAKLMNSICFDAFTPGNHEFDDGDEALKTLLDQLADPLNGGNCGMSTVSANIRPKAGTALAPAGGKTYLKPYLVKQIDGVDVGIVGLTVAAKTVNSSRPLASTEFKDEATAAQQAIDELRAQGVRHIVLLSHLGYEADKKIAPQLTDVDVIIGGDSHSLLGDFSAVGVASSSGSYPTKVQNKSGETVCIGQAWEYAKAYGLMNVKFDDQARVQNCGGQAKLVIGDSFKRKDAAGTWQAMAPADNQALVAKLASSPSVQVAALDAGASATLKTYSDQVAAQKAIKIGSASEALCLVRMPGESTNRSGTTAGCESANSLARGSDAAQVVAEAFLNASKRADFALQNAGGVRIAIPAGDLSMNTAFTVLPFTNLLVEMNLTGDQIIAALEDGVANYDASSSTGSHPYAAGLRWDLDLSKAKGQRFSNLQVRNKTSGAWSAIDKTKTYVLVTNDFVAAGGDGYATLGAQYKAGNYVNTYLLYTQSFVDYVKARGSIARPVRADYSHQQVISKTGITLSAD